MQLIAVFLILLVTVVLPIVLALLVGLAVLVLLLCFATAAIVGWLLWWSASYAGLADEMATAIGIIAGLFVFATLLWQIRRKAQS